MLNMTFSGLLSTVNPIDAITERMFAFGASLPPLLCGLGRIILYENKYILKIHRELFPGFISVYRHTEP